MQKSKACQRAREGHSTGFAGWYAARADDWQESAFIRVLMRSEKG